MPFASPETRCLAEDPGLSRASGPWYLTLMKRVVRNPALLLAGCVLLLPGPATGQEDDVLVAEDAAETEDEPVPAASAATVEKLATMLRAHSSFRARATAAVALGRLRDGRGERALSSALDTDPHYAVRAAAASALARLRDEAGVSALLRALDDPDPAVRETSREALGAFHAPKHLDTFAEATTSEDPRVRRAAVHAYGDALRDGHDAASGVVLASLGDEDADVREIGERAVKTLNHERSLPILLRGLDYVATPVRAHAAKMLGERPDERAVGALVAALSRTGERREVHEAVRAALRKNADYIDRSAVARRARDSASGDDASRIEALRIVGALGDRGAENIIEAALVDSSSQVRSSAARAAADLGADRGRSLVEKALARETDERVRRGHQLVLKTMR